MRVFQWTQICKIGFSRFWILLTFKLTFIIFKKFFYYYLLKNYEYEQYLSSYFYYQHLFYLIKKTLTFLISKCIYRKPIINAGKISSEINDLQHFCWDLRVWDLKKVTLSFDSDFCQVSLATSWTALLSVLYKVIH